MNEIKYLIVMVWSVTWYDYTDVNVLAKSCYNKSCW
jgi:hypothetical protein